MAYQAIGLGTSAGDGTGDSIRAGGDKVNDNFVEMYTLLGTGTALSSGISATASVVTLTAALATTSFSPSSADAATLGTTSLEWSDLYLADSSVIYFGADQDTTLTHTDGSGLTLNSTNKLMFNDASQFIQGTSATVLSIGATDEIDLTATAVDLNGTLNVSGTLTQTGVATFAARPVFNASVTIQNDGQIGSVGDADSMAIASNGVVTFSQIPVLPANSIDSDHYVDNSIEEAHMANDAIGSAELKTLSTLTVKNSGGSTLATFHTAGV